MTEQDDSLHESAQSAALGWARAHQLNAQVQQLNTEVQQAWNHAEKLETEAARAWERAQELDIENTRAWSRVHELEAEIGRLSQLAQKHAGLTRHHAQSLATATYHADGLAVWDKSVDFLKEPRHHAAYQASMEAWQHIRPQVNGPEFHIEWRVHVLCWAAAYASHLKGDFIECSVNSGIYARAVCEYLDFNKLDRDFYLFDTFNGIPENQMLEEERATRRAWNATYFPECLDMARQVFAKYPRVRLVRGLVPDAFNATSIKEVCYLLLDTNIVKPEIASIEFLWGKLVPGGIVVLNNYGWLTNRLQKEAMDDFARRVGAEILLCPTGQGILLHP